MNEGYEMQSVDEKGKRVCGGCRNGMYRGIRGMGEKGQCRGYINH